MIYKNYLFNLLRGHLVLLLVATALVCAFQVLILALVEETDLMGVVQVAISRMPAMMQAFFAEEFMAQFSTTGAVGFGYNHPLVLVTVTLVAIVLPSRHIAGEIEMGTLELLFAMPVKRYGIAITLWLGSALALMILLAGCLTGTAIGLLLYPDLRSVASESLLRLGANLWLLAFTISSYALLIAAFAREGGKAALRAAGLTLFFYFLHIAARLWSGLSFLKPFTVFHYYQPQQQMADPTIWGRNVAVLAAMTVVIGAAAVAKIERRDIPG